MMSPPGTDPFNAATWDPYSMKDPNNLKKECMDKCKVDRYLKKMESKAHPLCELHQIPSCLRWAIKGAAKGWTDGCFREDYYSEVVRAAAFEYFWEMLARPSILETVQILPFKFDSFGIHAL